MPDNIVVAGSGIIGISTALWLQRGGASVTLVDRGLPGSGASFGNAGVVAVSAVLPVLTMPILKKLPLLMFDPKFPLFMRPWYMPRALPWLARYLLNVSHAKTRRTAEALAFLTSDGLRQHRDLAAGTSAVAHLRPCSYNFVYPDREAFERDRYSWSLRAQFGFVPEQLEGESVRAFAPGLSPDLSFIAAVPGHLYVDTPQRYISALHEAFLAGGGRFVQDDIRTLSLTDGRVTAVRMTDKSLPCDAVVVAAGASSGRMLKPLGIRIPLESERGYHIEFENAGGFPQQPFMVTSGKFVATPIGGRLRCAGVTEIGGLDAGPSKAPLDFLKREARRAFPGLGEPAVAEWLGHRPVMADSLPMIGEIGKTGVFTAFGHHHIGLTTGPKTGRLLSDVMLGHADPGTLRAFSPNRYIRAG